MRTVEVNNKTYIVTSEHINQTSEFIEKIKGHYESIYSDFFLLKSKDKNEYLVCREIIDVDLSDDD